MTQDGWQQAPSAPQSPPNSPYGGAPMGGQPLKQGGPTNGKAIAALILGIAGCCVLPLILGIPALILGIMARKEIEASNGQQEGNGMAMAGIILGIISIIGGILYLIFMVFAIASVPTECFTDPDLPQCENPSTGVSFPLPALAAPLLLWVKMPRTIVTTVQGSGPKG